jgi:hypothetical protein
MIIIIFNRMWITKSATELNDDILRYIMGIPIYGFEFKRYSNFYSNVLMDLLFLKFKFSLFKFINCNIEI